MTFLVPLGALGLLAIPAIVLLYFLKVRRPRVEVASLLFWTRFLADRQANAPWQRLRPSLLLLLQLLAAAAIGLALARPALPGAAGVAGTTVVVLDGSASMRATDVAPSRFDAAVGRARDLVSQLRPGQEMAIVVAGAHAELLAPAGGDSAQLNAALGRARPGTGTGNLDEAFSLASAVLAGRPDGSIVLIGDGHAAASPGPRVPAPLTYIQVGSTATNTAIDGLALLPSGAIYIRLAGYGPGTRSVQVRLLADGRQVDVLPAQVPGGGASDLTWTGLPRGTRTLEAQLEPGDSFALDDSAWIVTGAVTKRQVLLVTSQNGFLARALSLRPDVKLTVQTPATYKPGAYDLYVFDRFVPHGPLPSPALLVDPPTGLGPVPGGQAVDPGPVVPPAPGDPLLAGVDLRDVHVQTASLTAPPADWRTVITGANAPLLLVHDGQPGLAELTFDLHHSDLPLRAAFPILVRNLLDQLLPGGFAGRVFQAGQPVPLVADPGARSLTVTTPAGTTSRLTGTAPVLTDTTAAGIYRVTEQLASGSVEEDFAVDFRDPELSNIVPGPAPNVAVASAPARAVERGALEIWPWLAGLLVALLLLEWFVYHRGSLRWA